MPPIGVLAAAADEPNTAVLTALIGSGATVIVALVGLVGTVLLRRQENRPQSPSGEEDDTERDLGTLVRALARTERERDDAERRAEACEQRERGGHANE